MLYDPAIDARPVAEIHSPSGLGAYRPGLVLGWRTSVCSPSTNTQYVYVLQDRSFAGVAEVDLIAGMRTWKVSEATKQWQRHVFDPQASTHVDALTETVEATLDFIIEFGPEAFALTAVRDEFVQAEHLAALLRASSTWRDQIPGWNDALLAAVLAVNSSGQDPEDVLFGMV